MFPRPRDVANAGLPAGLLRGVVGIQPYSGSASQRYQRLRAEFEAQPSTATVRIDDSEGLQRTACSNATDSSGHFLWRRGGASNGTCGGFDFKMTRSAACQAEGGSAACDDARFHSTEHFYTPFAYDATIAMLRAADAVIRGAIESKKKPPFDPQQLFAKLASASLEAFDGWTGPVAFDDDGERCAENLPFLITSHDGSDVLTGFRVAGALLTPHGNCAVGGLTGSGPSPISWCQASGQLVLPSALGDGHDRLECRSAGVVYHTDNGGMPSATMLPQCWWRRDECTEGAYEDGVSGECHCCQACSEWHKLVGCSGYAGSSRGSCEPLPQVWVLATLLGLAVLFPYGAFGVMSNRRATQERRKRKKAERLLGTLLLGRFRIPDRMPRYRSASCLLYFAKEVDKLDEHGDLMPVALKFTASDDREGFEAEVKAREALQGFATGIVAQLDHVDFSDAAAEPFPGTEGVDKEGNPETVTVADFPFCIVMEQGSRNLDEFVRGIQTSGQTLQGVAEMVRNVAEAVKQMHDHGWCHLDIKPRNIVMYQSRWKLIDLDSSGRIGDNLPGGSKASTGYKAPECMRHDSHSSDELTIHPSMDVWSLGIMMYFLVCSQSLFNVDAFDDLKDDEEKDKLLRWSGLGDEASFLEPQSPLRRTRAPKSMLPRTTSAADLRRAEEAAVRMARAQRISSGRKASIETQEDEELEAAQDLLQWCLEPDPRNRPTIISLLSHRFLKPVGGLLRKDASKVTIRWRDIALSDEAKIGEGAGGAAFAAVFQGKSVVVKYVKLGQEAEALREAELARKLQHANVLKMYGVTLRGGRTCTVAERMMLFDLERSFWHRWGSALESSNRSQLQVADAAMILQQAAAGLAYMNGEGFAHRDVACRNVFCTASLVKGGRLQRGEDGGIAGLRVCIADFGRTVRLPAAGKSAKTPLDPAGRALSQPLRDQPPEVLVSKVFTERSDSFSFGVAMWALMSGTRPWPSLTPQEAARKHVSGERLPPPQTRLADAKLSAIMHQCWRHDERERPLMAEVHDMLASRLAELRAAGPQRAEPPRAGVDSVALNLDGEEKAGGGADNVDRLRRTASEYAAYRAGASGGTQAVPLGKSTDPCTRIKMSLPKMLPVSPEDGQRKMGRTPVPPRISRKADDGDGKTDSRHGHGAASTAVDSQAAAPDAQTANADDSDKDYGDDVSDYDQCERPVAVTVADETAKNGATTTAEDPTPKATPIGGDIPPPAPPSTKRGTTIELAERRRAVVSL